MHSHSPTCPCCNEVEAPFRVNASVARRYDPTNTTTVRNRFAGEATRRFMDLRKAIKEAIPALYPIKVNAPASGPQPGEFNFERSDRKVDAFMNWLKQKEKQKILTVTTGQSSRYVMAQNRPWYNLYIDSAYQRGMRQAMQQLRQKGGSVDDSYLNAFFQPMHADQVGLIYTRTYHKLEGITNAMSSQIADVLALGMAEGIGAEELWSRLSDRVDKIGITRARTLARTEVIAAHADATLNTYEDAGIEGVNLRGEILTARDLNVCPICDKLSKRTFTIAKARGIIPVHPHCRCAWGPVVLDPKGIRLS